MFENNYHLCDITSKTFLVTGGAGFIGSNLVEYLLKFNAGKVKVLDNLSNGYYKNIEPFLSNPSFEFINGDLLNEDTCLKACEGVQIVFHQAALGSVPRSIKMPLATNEANVTGFLNTLVAAKDSGVERFVYASSSSVYGDSPLMPKKEDIIGNALSPYAVSKRVNELYAKVFGEVYGIKTIGLRYFNVFGPRQNPKNPYAAVIPLFVYALLDGKAPVINGDGTQTRDFTFVENAVQANIRAAFTEHPDAFNKVYNAAVGDRISLNDLYQYLQEISEINIPAHYTAPRAGDIHDSHADISQARTLLGYDPKYKVKEGLEILFKWYKENRAFLEKE
ncbi:MAG TPA: SDR family oxidoreductase [Cytophagaceae bacterium]|jgi:UDP-N-acetylglucosamine 4-epimerase|nr:SDR family oxidoreductase [Cytophagaceae bacterium]